MSAATPDVDVLIIGGGIVGCATALALAREGVDVAVVDRHDLHTQASGSNAGNIHQQLLTAHAVRNKGWDWIECNAETVRLNVAAGQIWRDLAGELDRDIELKFLGGLMVGETDEDMRTIERKVAFERRWGGGTELVSRTELRRLAPYLADDLVGGAFCADEGKANPLLAVPAIARAAAKAGARLLRRREVQAIEPDRRGFAVQTGEGSIRCRRIVNAAGARCADISAMLGIHMPFAARIIQTVVTEAVRPVLQHLLYHASRPLTMKQVANGNVIIGGGWPGDADPETGHPIVRRESVTGSAWVAQRVAPEVGGLRLIRAWAAYISQPDDGIPICGEVPGQRGFFLATTNSYGFTLGPLMGRILADQLTARASSIDVKLLRVDRDYSRGRED